MICKYINFRSNWNLDFKMTCAYNSQHGPCEFYIDILALSSTVSSSVSTFLLQTYTLLLWLVYGLTTMTWVTLKLLVKKANTVFYTRDKATNMTYHAPLTSAESLIKHTTTKTCKKTKKKTTTLHVRQIMLGLLNAIFSRPNFGRVCIIVMSSYILNFPNFCRL